MIKVTERTWSIYWIVHPFKDGKTDHFHGHELKRLTYPVRVFNNRMWFIRYMACLLQVRFPKHYIDQHTSCLYPDIPDDIILKRRLSAAKAQITKVENVINNYTEEQNKKLFGLEKEDPIMEKLLLKLEEKKLKYSNLINE